MFSFLKNSTLSRSELNYESGKFKYIHYGDILTKFGDITDTCNFSVPFVTTPEKVIKLEKYFLQNGDVIIADTAEDSMVGKVTEIQNSDPFPTVSGLHTIPIRPNKEFAAGFLGHYMNAPFYHDQLFKLMQGVKVLSLSKNAVIQTKINSPSYCDQNLISRTIDLIDGTITLHEEKKRQLERLKSALLQKMFADKSGYPDVRFKGFNEAWTNRKLGNYFDYEQPTPYIVTNTNYSDEYNTPVLTAGQSFILCYTDEDTGVKCATYKEPVIIFDDFTTSTHLVTFPFKVKSSAMKILTLTQKNDSMYFGYTSLQNIKYKPLNHERQWISIFSKIKIGIPISKIEERKIGNLFERIDRLDNYFQQKIERLNSIKQSLLQRMFI